MSDSVNTEPKSFMSELDTSLYEYYKKFPELIIRSGAWRAVALCNACLGEIPFDSKALLDCTVDCTFDSSQEYEDVDVICPHCRFSGEKTIPSRWNGKDKIIIKPVPHTKVRIRTHVVGEETTGFLFWKKTIVTKAFNEIITL